MEKRLVEAARAGTELVCGDRTAAQLADSADAEHVVRAELIRELLLGRCGDLDPRGVRIRGAQLIGNFDLRYVHATVGLQLVNCAAKQPLHLTDARLPRLHLTGSHVPNLDGDGLEVDGTVFLNGGFTATGDGEKGAVRLLSAHIGGQLNLRGAHITNQHGPAFAADGLQVDGNAFFNAGFTVTGDGEKGAVRLLSAHIGGELNLRGAHITNRRGAVLDLQIARTTSLLLPAAVVCPSRTKTTTACSTPARHIDVDGLAYTFITDASWRQWLHLLRRHTRRYRPMPYQQLAAVLKAAGHDGDARRVLIAQQKDLHARGQIGGRSARAVHWLWGALAGYGYRAGRTALALLIVLALAGGAGWWAGHTVTGPGQHAVQHTTSSTQPGTACSPLEQIGLGIDRGLPLGSTGIRTYCDLNTASPAGEWFTLAIWLLQAMIWALATLAIAGYTGLIRKIT